MDQIHLLAHLGTTLVQNTTKYLSTLPHPIECLEELVAVVAVTSNLLASLNWFALYKTGEERCKSSSPPANCSYIVLPISPIAAGYTAYHTSKPECAIIKKNALIEERVEAKQQPFFGGTSPYAKHHV